MFDLGFVSGPALGAAIGYSASKFDAAIGAKVIAMGTMKKEANRYSNNTKMREYILKRVEIENKEIELMKNILVAQKSINKLVKKKYKKEKKIWVMRKNVDLDVLNSIYNNNPELKDTLGVIEGLHKSVSAWHSVKKEKNLLHNKLIQDTNLINSKEASGLDPGALPKLYTDFAKIHKFYSERRSENKEILHKITAHRHSLSVVEKTIGTKTMTNIGLAIDKLIELEESESALESNILEKIKNVNVDDPYKTIQEIIGDVKGTENKRRLKWLTLNSRKYDEKFRSHLKHGFGGFTLKHSHDTLGNLSKKMKKLSNSRSYKMYNSLLESIDNAQSPAEILNNIEQRKNELTETNFMQDLNKKLEDTKQRSEDVIGAENNINQKKQDLIKRKNDGENVNIEEKKLSKIINQIEKYKKLIEQLYLALHQSINETMRLHTIIGAAAVNNSVIDANEVKSIVKKLELLLSGIANYEDKLELEDLNDARRLVKKLELIKKSREKDQKELIKYYLITLNSYLNLRELILFPSSSSKLYRKFIGAMQAQGLSVDEVRADEAILNSSAASLNSEERILDKDKQVMELIKQRIQLLQPIIIQKYKAWETYHKKGDSLNEGTVGHWATQVKNASTKILSSLAKI